jgi:phosphatidate cytidylyltransferase
MNMKEEKEILVQNKNQILKKAKLRIGSALFILLTFSIGLVYSKYIFLFLIFCVFIGMMIEWYIMCHSSSLYLMIGLVIFPFSCGSLVIARFVEKDYMPLLIYFVIIWTVDTMALVGGKIIGGVKLAPKISPNKTWSGLLVGALSASVMILFLSSATQYNYHVFNKIGVTSYSTLSIFAFFLAILSQISDLFISFFKRKFNVKDSGKIIPGHGGMIDRFDSIILTSPVILYIVL